MEISIIQSKILKTIAIIMMLILHLFNRSYDGIFTPHYLIAKESLSYYISLFCDACVPVFLFISGYGLYFNYQKNKYIIVKSNVVRLFKLYINYWLVVVLFAVLLGFFLDKEGYPGSFGKFVLNFLGLDNSYNGAWWFFFTYILLTLLAPNLFRVIDSSNTWLFLAVVLIIYFASFYLKYYHNFLFSSPYLAWFFKQACLLGTSLFPFIVGAIVFKKKWHSLFSKHFMSIKNRNVAAIVGITILIVIHGIVPNLIIAPFLAIPFVFLWNQITFGKYTESFLLLMSEHTTNIWLVHMFFLVTYFESFIYAAKYPILIFANLLFWSLVASFIIKLVYKPIINHLDLKIIK